jgi:hypothetical protein
VEVDALQGDAVHLCLGLTDAAEDVPGPVFHLCRQGACGKHPVDVGPGPVMVLLGAGHLAAHPLDPLALLATAGEGPPGHRELQQLGLDVGGVHPQVDEQAEDHVA